MAVSEQEKQEFPTYETCASLLLEVGIYNEPAYLHGALCGLIITTGGVDVNDWLKILAPQHLRWHIFPEEAQKLLSTLIDITLADFHDLESHFGLLLPEEETYLLEERVRAFGMWCEGFLEGLKFGGNYFRFPRSPEIDEMMTDLKEMTEIDERVDEVEEQEKAFFELEEYVKVAVLLLQAEFSELRSKTKGTKSVH